MTDEPQETPSKEVVLRISQVTKTYTMGEVKVEALRSVSLDFYSGELAVLLGTSGSGKSTLLNIIGGLDVPTSGKIFFHGREMTAA
ncbi:MAG: ATP-binding cassette domain-containing protein, partial [Chlorobiales bacterium]|nr:ATP-binding cassette domain-containing protein [Chlorobiales bacterium]